MKTEIKDRLVSLLESGEYNKSYASLYNREDDCHCVLGVLIEMAIDAGVYEPSVRTGSSGKKYIANISAFTLNDDIRQWAGSNEDELYSLADVNDEANSWDEVISYIKENL